MVNVIDISNNDDLSAFLTAAFISQTYRVESTWSIVDVWNNIRKNIKINNNLDCVSQLLAMGRLMDLKSELDDTKFNNMLNELTTTIMKDLKNRGHGPDIKDSNFITAMISAAYVSRTDEIETINEIINKWEELAKGIVIEDDIDKLSGILTMGRIMETKYKIDSINQIADIFNMFKEDIKNVVKQEIQQKDFAAALITNAYLEISPKVERVQDIIELWQKIQNELTIVDDIDYITSILAYGRIRDLDAQYFFTGSSVNEIRENIRNLIESKG